MKHGHGTPGPLVHSEPTAVANVSDKRIEEADEGTYGHTHINFWPTCRPTPATSWRSCWAISAKASSGRSSASRAATTTRRRKTRATTSGCGCRKFTVLDDAQREAIITFVLGLVAEPPASQYVYHGDAAARRDRPGQGSHREVQLHRLPHAGDGSLETGLRSGRFPVAGRRYPTIRSWHRTSRPQQVKASEATDIRGLRHATITGMPAVDEEGRPLRLDEDGAPLEADDTSTKAFYSFVLWDKRADQRRDLAGGFAEPAGARVGRGEEVSSRWAASSRGWRIRWWWPRKRRSTRRPRPTRLGAGCRRRWSRRHEGADRLAARLPARSACRSARPSCCGCRSSTCRPPDATKLVNYFAAVDGAEYPYDFDPRTRQSYLAAEDESHPNRLSDALKIVTRQQFLHQVPPAAGLQPHGQRPGQGAATGRRLQAAASRLCLRRGLPIPSGSCRTRACRSTFRTTSR